MLLEEQIICLIIIFTNMKFKDIVNRNNFNQQTCEMEPIHIPGSIQPHGFLLAFDIKSLEIQFCSENIKEFISIDYKELLGENLSLILGAEYITQLYEPDFTLSETKLIQISLNGQDFNISLSINEDTVIAEGEPVFEEKELKVDLYSSSKQMLAYVEHAYTLKQLCNVVARSIKNITGYERVMIYRFDKDYN